MLINAKMVRVKPTPTHIEICQYQGRNKIAVNNELPILILHSRGDIKSHLDVKKVLRFECVSNLWYCEKDPVTIFFVNVKFEFPADCWSEAEIPTFGAVRDEFKWG